MKLHTCFISFNRIELTKRAVASYLETVTLPYTMIVVDNNSSDGTREWLSEQEFPSLLLDTNRYPGFACNRGWEHAPADADFFQRADNDNGFIPGWCEHIGECFEGRPDLGQLGLRTDEWDGYNTKNVAGDCIIRRELWEKGLRWCELPWGSGFYDIGHGESSPMAKAVVALRYRWDRVERPCIESLAPEDPNDPYYIESWTTRGILEWARKRHGIGK